MHYSWPKKFQFNIGARKDIRDTMLVPIRNYFLSQKGNYLFRINTFTFIFFLFFITGLPEEVIETKPEKEIIPVPAIPSKSAYVLCQQYLAVANHSDKVSKFIDGLQKQGLFN